MSQNKEIAIDWYYAFKENGVYASDHFIERFMNRSKAKNGVMQYTFEDVVEASKKEYIYRDARNGRYIQSLNAVNLIYDIENQERKYISIRDKGVSKHWIPKDDYKN